LALETQSLTLERLGMAPRDLTAFADAIDKPHGMILLTGPTGSGKTSTFYSALRRIQEHGKSSIITIEDPVEFDLPKIPQVEVDQERFTYAKALRSVLRHDPDVIMVGEIRDEETAEIAVRAAITGHLVLSTLHTRSAANAITRLVDIGVEPFLVAATIRLVVAQRLVRRICPHCRVPRAIEPREALLLGDSALAGQQAFRGAGCKYCGGRGMSGRQAIFEVLPVDDDLGRSIAAGASEGSIIADLRQRGHRTLSADGREKILNGITTVDEVLRVAGGEM
jgi:type II secretory ATPase GspE/PulE/Tfp pilus assembly ATPase PilB-like protein